MKTGIDERVRRLAVMEFDRCRSDVEYFISNYLQIEDKDSSGLMIPFRLWSAQADALRSVMVNKYNIILKARQVGFTWLILAYALHDLIFNCGHTAIAISKTENDGFELVRRFSVLPTKALYALLTRNGFIFDFANKSEVRISDGNISSRFICFPASSDAARSFTGNILFFDEFAFTKNAAALWTGAQATVNRPGGGRVIVLSTMLRGTKYEALWNDTGNGFNRIFIGCFADPSRTEEWYEETRRVQGKKTLQEYPRTAEEALANLDGLFFEEFDLSLHSCIPFEIPGNWRIYSAMDYGLDMLAYYKIAVDERGCAYVFYEVYESGLTVAEAAERIRAGDERDGLKWLVPVERLAPPDLFRTTAESGRSQALCFSEQGIDLIRVSNDREAGWLALKELLRFGKLKIFSSCVNLLRTLSQICIDEKRPGDCRKDPHELTHAPDALRYFSIWYHVAAESVVGADLREWTDDIYDDYVMGDAATRALILKRYGMPQNYEIEVGERFTLF